MQISTLLTAAAVAVVASSASTVRSSSSSSTHVADPAKDTSSGPVGVLSRFDDEMFAMSRIMLAGVSSPLARDDGSYTTCLPVYGGATVADCTTVLGFIGDTPDEIGVAPGYCLNWWSGTCLAKICAVDGGSASNTTVPYYEKRSVISGRLGGDPLNVCINKGEAAAVSDDPDYASYKGLYRYYMQIRK